MGTEPSGAVIFEVQGADIAEAGIFGIVRDHTQAAGLLDFGDLGLSDEADDDGVTVDEPVDITFEDALPDDEEATDDPPSGFALIGISRPWMRRRGGRIGLIWRSDAPFLVMNMSSSLSSTNPPSGACWLFHRLS